PIITVSSTYSNLPKAFWRLKAYNRVNGPILPMYMVRIITILPTPLNFDVIPRESPTVLKAEKTSKSASLMLATGWVSKRIKEERKMMHIAKVTTVNAFMTDSKGKVL
ncbi:unnamed protein product, partial [marine sediment metagenome]